MNSAQSVIVNVFGEQESLGWGEQAIWCPEDLTLDHLGLASSIQWGVLALGHLVLSQLAHDARYRDKGRAPLKTKDMRQQIGRHCLDKVREVAQRHGYVDRSLSYQPGRKSQEYWILPPYASARLVHRRIGDTSLRKRFRTWQGERTQRMWERIRRNETPVQSNVAEHLWRHLLRVQIDDDIDLERNVHACHQIAIDDLRCGRFRLAVDDYGRIHTNLTNLKSELRENLTVDGQGLVNVDIGESQPLFVGLSTAQEAAQGCRKGSGSGGEGEPRGTKQYHMLANTMMANTMLAKSPRLVRNLDRTRLPRDLNDYLTLCERRGLYQAVADELGVNRDEAKKRVLQAFYDKPIHRNRVHDVLEGRFPSVMDFLERAKRDDHRRLAHAAQRIESQFMFGRVIPRVMAERPDLFVSTIHDSVLTTVGNEGYIRQIILDAFAELGMEPQVRIEPCNKHVSVLPGAERGDPHWQARTDKEFITPK